MDENAKKRLWEDYTRLGDSALREKLILEYAPLVKLVAGRLVMYLGYNVEYEDLVSYGTFGLIDAIDKFDYRKGIKFETYASLRIRGAILDQIRKNDWIPRTVRQRQKQIDAAIKQVEEKTGHPATDEEIAEALGISGDDLLEWQSQMKCTNLVSLNEYMDSGAEVANDPHQAGHMITPEEALDNSEMREMLAQALEELSDKEKKVVLLYYYEEQTLKEISQVLEVTKSRISQLHTRALQKMRGIMGDYVGVLAHI